MIKLKDFLKRAFITRKCILCGDVIDYKRDAPFCDERTHNGVYLAGVYLKIDTPQYLLTSNRGVQILYL